ncbi:MAG: hypothetical protein AAF211_09840, partial [Myxococcota bacterium]
MLVALLLSAQAQPTVVDQCLDDEAPSACLEAWQEADLDWAWATVERSLGRGHPERVRSLGNRAELLRREACRTGHRPACVEACERGDLETFDPCAQAGVCDETSLGDRLTLCEQAGGDHPACDIGVAVLGRYPKAWTEARLTPWGVVSVENNRWTDGRGRFAPLFEPAVLGDFGLGGIVDANGRVALVSREARNRYAGPEDDFVVSVFLDRRGLHTSPTPIDEVLGPVLDREGGRVIGIGGGWAWQLVGAERPGRS